MDANAVKPQPPAVDAVTAPEPLSISTARAGIVRALGGEGVGRRKYLEVRDPLEQALDTLNALQATEVLGVPTGAVAGQPTSRALDVLKEHSWLLKDGQVPTKDQAWALANSLRAVWISTATEQEIDVAIDNYSYPAPPDDLERDHRRAWLQQAHSDRQRAMTHDRARAELRTRYLTQAGWVLTGLVAVAWTLAAVLSDMATVVSLCGLAGAIGGAVHGARGLRDSRKLRDTKLYQTWWWVHPVVGASAGLFVVALLSSPVLTLPGTGGDVGAAERAAALIVYSFLAGFSEPWLLGLMDRVGGSADRAAVESSSAKETRDRPPAHPDADVPTGRSV